MGRRTAAAVAAAAAALALAAPAAAQQDQGQQGGAGDRSILLLMDGSKSMNTPAGGGLTRLDAAKRAVRGLLGTIPQGADVGLRVYGSRVSEASRAEGCADTVLAVPVGPLDRAAMQARTDALQGKGRTPIGRSLLKAPDDLPAGGRRTVILVSDGGDNCAPPDPCDAAREVARRGVELTIQVVGLQVNERVRRQLQCIARAGGGTYVDAKDPKALEDELRAAFARAFRGYEPSGAPVQGGPARGQATTVGTGRYLDHFAAGQERWYAVDVPAGYRLMLGATAIPDGPLDGQADFGGEVYDAGGRRVGGDSELLTGVALEFGTVVTVALAGPPAGDDPDGPEPGRWLVHVGLTSATFKDRTVPVELGLDVARPGEAPDFGGGPVVMPTPAATGGASGGSGGDGADGGGGGTSPGLVALLAVLGALAGAAAGTVLVRRRPA
jgi:hypothetical protein